MEMYRYIYQCMDIHGLYGYANQIQSICVCFPKMVGFPTNHGYSEIPTKNHHDLGCEMCFGEAHHLRKQPWYLQTKKHAQNDLWVLRSSLGQVLVTTRCNGGRKRPDCEDLGSQVGGGLIPLNFGCPGCLEVDGSMVYGITGLSYNLLINGIYWLVVIGSLG